MWHLKSNHLMVYTTLNRTKKRASSPSNPTESLPVTVTEKSSQPTIIEVVESRAPLQPDQKRTEEITDVITYHLAKDSVAFNAVDRPEFQRIDFFAFVFFIYTRVCLPCMHNYKMAGKLSFLFTTNIDIADIIDIFSISHQPITSVSQRRGRICMYM